MVKCPLDKRDQGTYCGVPPGGTFEITSEYQIGAQRIAEEVHCILGSLNKIANGSRVEEGHIYEELKLIKKNLNEKSKDLYTRQITRGRLSDKKERIYKEIKENSQKMIKIAKKEKSRLSSCPKKYSELGIVEIAKNCYDVLIKLGEAMSKSAEKILSINAFRDKSLKQSVKKLEKSIDKKYRQNNQSFTNGLVF